MSEVGAILFFIGLCAALLLFVIVIPSLVDAWHEHKWQQAVKEYYAREGEDK